MFCCLRVDDFDEACEHQVVYVESFRSVDPAGGTDAKLVNPWSRGALSAGNGEKPSSRLEVSPYRTSFDGCQNIPDP